MQSYFKESWYLPLFPFLIPLFPSPFSSLSLSKYLSFHAYPLQKVKFARKGRAFLVFLLRVKTWWLVALSWTVHKNFIGASKNKNDHIAYWTFLYCYLYSYCSSKLAIVKFVAPGLFASFLYRFCTSVNCYTILIGFSYSYRSSNSCETNSSRSYWPLNKRAKSH